MEIRREIVKNVPEINSFQVGVPQMIKHGKKEVPTAIYKQFSNKSHYVSSLGVEGDEQGDKIHHGGVDKAVCVYLQESYKHWDQLGRPLEPGAFGENMTISGLEEDQVLIGNTYRIGSLIVQVSQPRQPCFKLGIRNEWPQLVQLSMESGYTGFYLRVLEEGEASLGMEVELIEQAQHSMSIKAANRIMYSKQSTVQQYVQLASITELAEVWKESLARKIEKLKQQTR